MADQGRGGWLSPWLRARRFARALPYLRGRVLDVGCGVGMLAAHVDPERYLGVDPDATALAAAAAAFPRHRFVAVLPSTGPFDTIVALAVLEHLPDPEASLSAWAELLSPAGRIVLTTPRPGYMWLHEIGAALRLFSREAAEEHHRFFDRDAIGHAARTAGLRLDQGRCFLLGANQLFILAAKAP